MIQHCDSTVLKSLAMILNKYLLTGVFQNDWKKSNVVPIHKKCDKQYFFERIIYNSFYSFMENNNLFCTNQAGFRSSDSCINQRISITHLCYQAFDCNPSLEARAVYLDISKAFDKVWHDGLVFKLECIGVERQLLKLLIVF